MNQIDRRRFFYCSVAMLLLAGCNMGPSTSLPYSMATTTSSSGATTTSSPGTTGTAPTAVSVQVGITQPSIFVSQYGQDPISVLVFAGTASGPSAPYLEIPGWLPAMDAAGNLYIVSCYFGAPYPCSPNIDVYPPDSVGGKPLRSLHTNIVNVYDMTVSKTGEIFVADGNGVAVFSAAATGDDPPVRYIQWNSDKIAVDGSGNLYIRSGGSIAVFPPTATGFVAPARLIVGPHTTIRAGYAPDYGAIAVDAQGHLYVLCISERGDGLNSFGVLEFGPDADGDIASVRYVTTPGMTPAYEGTGLAVDSAGMIYVSASQTYDVAAVFEFPADASGSVTPATTITSGIFRENAGGIAVH